jgi:hypothetical protein
MFGLSYYSEESNPPPLIKAQIRTMRAICGALAKDQSTKKKADRIAIPDWEKELLSRAEESLASYVYRYVASAIS